MDVFTDDSRKTYHKMVLLMADTPGMKANVKDVTSVKSYIPSSQNPHSFGTLPSFLYRLDIGMPVE